MNTHVLLALSLPLFFLANASRGQAPASAPATAPGIDPALTEEVFKRAMVATGDLSPLQRVMAKAQRGEAITIATLGGSITQGSQARRPANRYPNVITAWWQAAFPKAKVTLVNAGIGSTGSDFGALRVGSQVLAHHPDLVVVEFAVNDANTRQKAETYEGVLRQVLSDAGNPAVVMLFMSDHGRNAQPQESLLGAHYNLPMVSYRDALWPEIDAMRLPLDQITADNLHPNDRGHVITGQLLDHLFEKALAEMPAGGVAPAAGKLPAAMLSETFEHVFFAEGADLKPTAAEGWAYDGAANVMAWKTDKPGSTIEFDVPGGAMVYLNYYRIHGPLGKVDVQVDGGAVKSIDAWFDQTWGGYRETTVVGTGLASEKHHVKVTLCAERNAQSAGNEFRITGLAAAGITK